MKYKTVRYLLLILVFSPSLLSAQSENSVEGDLKALTDLYHATGGDHWKNNRGWLEGNPSNAWYGIRVDRSGRVIQIRLQDNNLNGSLPSSLGNLSRVAYFNVKQNHLAGEIPSSIGNMVSLMYLLLNGRVDDMETNSSHHPGKQPGGSYAAERSNDFTGPIPSSIGNLTDLLYFELNGTGKDNTTGLTGAIPPEIGNLTRLRGLHLGFNSLTSLPSSMQNLTNLVHLAILRNDLAGHRLPGWLENLTMLRNLWIQSNDLGGRLPDLSNLTDLRILAANSNGFTGPFPAYLIDGTMPHINMIELGWNHFTGSLPEFGQTNLAAFTVNGNDLTGELPDLSSLTRMSNLGLGWNNFEGEIPDLSHMHQLRYVRVQDNNFTGTVPMVNMSNEKLQNLYYQNNNLSGYIDPALADVVDLPNFQTFNISNNNFSEADIQHLKDALDAKGKLNMLRYSRQNTEISRTDHK